MARKVVELLSQETKDIDLESGGQV
jgi:hypothetical protein